MVGCLDSGGPEAQGLDVVSVFDKKDACFQVVQLSEHLVVRIDGWGGAHGLIGYVAPRFLVGPHVCYDDSALSDMHRIVSPSYSTQTSDTLLYGRTGNWFQAI